MNGFFTNLVDRHLGTCDTIQPRSPGRFETDHNRVAEVSSSSAFGTGPDATEHDQRLKTSAEFSIDDSPTLATHKPDSIENKNDISSPSCSDQKNPPSKSTETEERVVLADTDALSRKPQTTHSLDIDMQSNQGMVKRDHQDKESLVDDNKTIKSYWDTNINKSDGVMRDNNLPPTSSTGEHHLDNELNHRIRAMLKRLTNDPLSPITPPDQDDCSSQNNNETLTSILSEKEIPSLDSKNASLVPAAASNRQAMREVGRFSEDEDITFGHSQLEPPPWLSDMTSQLKQRLQEKQTKAEPVINVTIGRVEVRAVQAETSKRVRHTKQPTGVMTLEDYLKQRENRGSR